METILAKVSMRLLMVLFQDENPILTVRILRFAICSSAVLAVVFGASWVLKQVSDMWK